MGHHEHTDSSHDNHPRKKGVKKSYGSHCPDYLDPDSDHFLREGHTTFPNHATVYQLTEPSEPAIETGRFAGIGEGYVVVMEQQIGGGFTECQIHQNKIVWDAII